MDIKLLGGKIAKARKEKSMSQAQLAQLLFISPQAVGKWERGESIPDIVTIHQLAEILEVDLNYFSENFKSAHEHTRFKSADTNVEDDELVEPGSDDLPRSQDRQLLTNFNGSNLADTDFAGVIAHNSKFKGSALRGSDFTGADLTGSSFMGSDVREANFDGTNLTDCSLAVIDLTGASFNKTVLIRTELSKSVLADAKFRDVKLIDVKLNMIDLRKTTFENCIFDGVDFTYSDLRGQHLDGLIFTNVKFNKAALNDVTFKGATLTNVSFRPQFALTNKYYKAIKTICFDEAKMDKLTYAALKGIGADLSKVTTI
ncbi:pentapeptide repeat-containing protein [Niabella hibiscisoli]|uniref:pentapeptide repeat-containing protein n=1 Tax=Niabella hibiscisoli TaxID=1825928 RepID=UPI001F0D73A1|nr:pentapeptide repeat-containing protein [Niabella hibiscisoli]MCH5717865.1 pentapeptide repeat-containing protein [Niabella hibiscisoli]